MKEVFRCVNSGLHLFLIRSPLSRDVLSFPIDEEARLTVLSMAFSMNAKIKKKKISVSKRRFKHYISSCFNGGNCA
jgi:hypothetical protein